MFHVSDNVLFVCFGSVFMLSVKKAFDSGRTPASLERAPLSDKTQFVGQRYTSLPLAMAKNPRRRISERSFENPPLRLLGPGRFPVQYYNRPDAKKPAERTGAVVGGHKTRNAKRLLYLASRTRSFTIKKMKLNNQNPASCTPFTSHSWNRYGIQERLLSPLHKRSRSRMNAVVNIRNHEFRNAKII